MLTIARRSAFVVGGVQSARGRGALDIAQRESFYGLVSSVL